jgi:hypothetical protein
MSDFIGNNAGLPAASAGNDELRAFGDLDRLSLHRIQIIEKIH